MGKSGGAQRDRLQATTGRHAAVRSPRAGRFPLEIKTGRHVAVRSPRAVPLPVIKANNSRETTRKKLRSAAIYHIAKWLRMKPMRWEFFMGYRCYSPNTWVMWTYPKSALSPISCVQTVACSIKNHKPWECKNLMQVSFKWLLEPHEIGVWHLQRAKTILYSWDGKSKKLDPPTTPISSVPSIRINKNYYITYKILYYYML